MKKERLLINTSGWFVFAIAIALTVYTITLEATTSFWDCGEFILSAAKPEVNHPLPNEKVSKSLLFRSGEFYKINRTVVIKNQIVVWFLMIGLHAKDNFCSIKER